MLFDFGHNIFYSPWMEHTQYNCTYHIEAICTAIILSELNILAFFSLLFVLVYLIQVFYVVQLVKLLELREANHIEFCRIKNVLDEILHMYGNSELNEILELLMDPTWVATGLKIDFETLVSNNMFYIFCM